MARSPALWLRFAALFLVFLVFSGCANKAKIYMDSLAAISLGMPNEEVQSKLGRTPKMEFPLEEAEECEVEVYSIVTGKDLVSSTIFLPGINGGPGRTQTIYNEVENLEPYFLLFKGGKLLYWGFLDEFGKSDDEEIRNLGPLIGQTYRQQVKAKKSSRQEVGGIS
jgi:hypothetical protein